MKKEEWPIIFLLQPLDFALISTNWFSSPNMDMA
jgi:hypothetical protein